MSYQCTLKARRNFPLTISYSFCGSKSLVAMIYSIWLHCLVKTPNAETPNTGAPKGQHTEGSKHRKVMILATQAWDGILYTAVVSCHTDISYRSDTSYNTDIYCLDIIYSHYNNTPSWHHIPSCGYHVMLIFTLLWGDLDREILVPCLWDRYDTMQISNICSQISIVIWWHLIIHCLNDLFLSFNLVL